MLYCNRPSVRLEGRINEKLVYGSGMIDKSCVSSESLDTQLLCAANLLSLK